MGPSYASGVSRLASRSRMLLRRRGSGRSLGGRWPLVPASDVPDSLINQVGHVTAALMSCDNHVISRQCLSSKASLEMPSSESSREQSVPFPYFQSPIPGTHPQNLDVNQAVNNLLSREDDDGGEGEGSEGDPLIPAAFFPSGGSPILQCPPLHVYMYMYMYIH